MGPDPIYIEVYEHKLGRPSQRWRWRAKGGNWLKLANGGEGYGKKGGVIHALHLLWPAGADSHVLVRLPGQGWVGLGLL